MINQPQNPVDPSSVAAAVQHAMAIQKIRLDFESNTKEITEAVRLFGGDYMALGADFTTERYQKCIEHLMRLRVALGKVGLIVHEAELAKSRKGGA